MTDAVWPQVEPLLAPALAYGNGGLVLEDIPQFLREGMMELVTIHDDSGLVAAAVVEVVQYPRRRSLRIVLIGGKGLQDWMMELREAVWAIGRRVGAGFVELHGRPGWERALRGMPGVRQLSTVVVMEIEHG